MPSNSNNKKKHSRILGDYGDEYDEPEYESNEEDYDENQDDWGS